METTNIAPTHPGWSVAGQLIDALTRRDFDEMQTLLDDGVRLRALVPRGPLEIDTAEAVSATFRSWFGGEDNFEVLDSSVGEVESRPYAHWRIRMCPPDLPEQSRVAEQHVFLTGTDRIATIDLLCSGFQTNAG